MAVTYQKHTSFLQYGVYSLVPTDLLQIGSHLEPSVVRGADVTYVRLVGMQTHPVHMHDDLHLPWHTCTNGSVSGRKGQRDLERQIRDNNRLEKVAQKQIREAAKRNDMASAKVLAKELVHTRRVTTRLWTNKAHMMSMNSQLTEQLGMVKVAGTLSKSTQVCSAHSHSLHPQKCPYSQKTAKLRSISDHIPWPCVPPVYMHPYVYMHFT